MNENDFVGSRNRPPNNNTNLIIGSVEQPRQHFIEVIIEVIGGGLSKTVHEPAPVLVFHQPVREHAETLVHPKTLHRLKVGRYFGN